MTADRGTTLFDLRPTQNEHRHRGIGRYVSGLAREMARLDPELGFLVHGDRPQPIAGLEARQYTSHRPHALRYHFGWLADEGLLALASARHRWQLFHATDPDAIPDPGLVRTIATAYDLTPLHDPRVWGGLTTDQRWGYRRMLGKLRRAARVVAISHAVRQDLVATLGIDPNVIDVVYPGIDIDAWQPPNRTEAASSRAGVLFVGAPGENKNVDLLVRALGSLPEPPRLTVAGPWPEDHRLRLEAACAPLGVPISVHPYAPDTQLRELYWSAAVTAVPSQHEGFGLPALEAMAAGCPVVVSDAPALAEVVGKAGVVVPRDDEHGLASAIASVLADAEARGRLGERGLEQARRFSWTASARVLSETYRQLL